MEIIPDWLTFQAIDFGYRAPACLWAQHSPARQLFLIDELLPANPTPKLVTVIKAREASFGLSVPPRASYCDPAGRAVNVQAATSEFERSCAMQVCIRWAES